jgi:hypothetical protein
MFIVGRSFNHYMIVYSFSGRFLHSKIGVDQSCAHPKSVTLPNLQPCTNTIPLLWTCQLCYSPKCKLWTSKNILCTTCDMNSLLIVMFQNVNIHFANVNICTCINCFYVHSKKRVMKIDFVNVGDHNYVTTVFQYF